MTAQEVLSGGAGTPRGLRWAFLDYDMPGLKTAVKIDGKINDPTHIDKGWMLEIAIPWQNMKWLANENRYRQNPEIRGRYFSDDFRK